MTQNQNKEIRDAVLTLDEVRTRLLDFPDSGDMNGNSYMFLSDGISSIEDAIDLLNLLIDE